MMQRVRDAESAQEKNAPLPGLLPLLLTRHRQVSPAALEMWEKTQHEAARTDQLDWVAEWAGMPPAEPDAAAPEPLPEPAPPAAAPPAPPANSAAKPLPVTTQSKPGAVARPAAETPSTAEDATTEQHIAAFQEAMVAMAETLVEARALDRDKADPKTATGD